MRLHVLQIFNKFDYNIQYYLSISIALLFQLFSTVPEIIDYYKKTALELTKKDKVCGSVSFTQSPSK